MRITEQQYNKFCKTNKVPIMGIDDVQPVRRKYNNRPETVTVGGKTYTFRSQLEIKVAKYLQLLKDCFEIRDWSYETTTFHFPDQIVGGTYIMDFDVRNNDNSFWYLEAKGVFDQHTRNRLKVLLDKKPEIKLHMVFQDKKTKLKFERSKLSRQCTRVCTLSELTRGII